MLGIGSHRDRDMCVLRVANAAPVTAAQFVTVLEAFPTETGPKLQASLDGVPARGILTLKAAERGWQFNLSTGRKNPAASIFRPVR